LFINYYSPELQTETKLRHWMGTCCSNLRCICTCWETDQTGNPGPQTAAEVHFLGPKLECFKLIRATLTPLHV